MAVIRKEAYYTSCNGVNSIRALIWQDDEKEPVAVIQIAHGLAEHRREPVPSLPADLHRMDGGGALAVFLRL